MHFVHKIPRRMETINLGREKMSSNLDIFQNKIIFASISKKENTITSNIFGSQNHFLNTFL